MSDQKLSHLCLWLMVIIAYKRTIIIIYAKILSLHYLFNYEVYVVMAL
jgi:hypothetical protein